MVSKSRQADPAVANLKVSAFVVPTDSPESAGTLEWNKTTLVVVEATAANRTGLGYTYADSSTDISSPKSRRKPPKYVMRSTSRRHGPQWRREFGITAGRVSRQWRWLRSTWRYGISRRGFWNNRSPACWDCVATPFQYTAAEGLPPIMTAS